MTPKDSESHASAENNAGKENGGEREEKLDSPNFSWGAFVVGIIGCGEIGFTLWLWGNFLECQHLAPLVLYAMALLFLDAIACYLIYGVFKKFRWSRLVLIFIWVSLTLLSAGVIWSNAHVKSVIPIATPAPSPAPTHAPTLQEVVEFYSKKAQAHEWKPPQLQGQSEVEVIFGGAHFDVPLAGNVFPSGEIVPMYVPPGGAVYIPYIKENRVYVKVQTIFGADQKTVEMNDEWIDPLPKGWDRNFDDKSFEVVDTDALPVFQVRYDAPNVIEINGVFVAGNGQITLAFLDPTGKMARLETVDPGKPIPAEMLNARKAWFKYPSERYQGILAN